MITYNVEGVKMPKIKKRENSAWVKSVAASYGKKVGEIAYIFVNDEKILEGNRQYLSHDYYPDIITFDYCEGDTIAGEWFSLSVWTPYVPMPNRSEPHMNRNFIVSSYTASCISAVLTTKGRVSAKSWKPPRTRRLQSVRN